MVEPQPRRTPLTYEDYLYLPEDGKRHELIDGEHFVTPAPIPKHQLAVVNLVTALHRFVADHSLGRVLTAPIDVVLSDTDVVQPDVLFVAADRLSIIGEKNLQGAPDLVVEVLSDSTRRTDEITKRRLYERFGVGEYWLIDPLLESAKVYRPGDDGAYTRVAEPSVEQGGGLDSPLVPGFEMAIGELFV
ncbi:MAG TPA: Uma2 family endonuclease [Thermoanaerobaculia bacterium]|nr:Uma2 family endonuclease [Thermoanaerobaculia bacterium]